MVAKKNFMQDRTALLLVSGNAFLAFLATMAVLLKLNTNQTSGNYIVSYRPTLGIDRYTSGTMWDILSFIAFAVMAFGIGLALGYRVYRVKRELALLILGLTMVLLTFSIVVSYSLLISR